ncbi:MAG: bacteriohemerythrin [Rhodospirillales bacterium]
MSESLARVHWRDEFSVGIASIDHEHRELIDLINRIFEHLDIGDRDTVADELGETYTRISAHFALEEQMMRDATYDQLPDHKTDHERLLDDIRAIMDAFEAGTYERNKTAFADRLQHWFVDHFKTKDARLHRHMKA